MSRPFRLSLASILVCLLSACANPAITMHSFGFDVLQDSPDVEVLNYRYGNSKQPGARPPDWALKEGRVSQGTSTHGEMLKGDELYVSWKIKSTGETFEETVDLRNRLPADIRNHQIYFIPRGRQLYVYLITPDRRLENEQPIGPRHTQYRKTFTLYPDGSK